MKDERLKNGGMQFITHYTERYSYLDAARMALEGGCRWVQLRMKDTPVETIEPVALEVQALCRQYGATFIIDDHVELARKLHADGVHLGKKDMPIADARRILGAEYIIGGTANTFEDVLQHYKAGADYIGCGPFRYTTTKKNLSPILGLEGYRSIGEEEQPMLLLLILADDFTGALDTGVQFAACGIATRVVVGEQVDFAANDAAVLVVDTETRHLPAAEAYAVIAKLTREAMSAGVFSIYKKTDSALRGNIGAELSALLKTSGERQLPFLPAFPQIDRVTRDGVHYISGVPVTESPFGIDPFEPVRHARVTELIGEQTDVPAHSFPTLKEDEAVPEQEGILVFDAGSLDDLASTGRALFQNGKPRLMAGCAGFAALLPDLMKMTERRTVTMPKLDPRLLVVCGSVNSITLRQLDVAEQNGFSRLRLTPRQKLDPGYWESENGKEALQGINEMLAANPRCIIETNDEGGNQPTADYAAARGLDLEGLRVGIASSIGHMLGKLFTSPALGTLLLTGGDTLLQCMNCVGIKELEPVCEMEKGVVLARFTYCGCTRYVITKSGGFGHEKLLLDLADRIAAEQT